MLKVRDLSCGYEDKTILKNVNFTVNSKDVVCILGSNGSGKSTLIKTIIGLLKAQEGSILVDDYSVNDLSWKERAGLISYIPQNFDSKFEYRCKDIVLMGRTSYLDILSLPSGEDRKIVEEAMDTLNISHLKNKIYSRLSDGERQLVKIDKALAQESKIIVMDEPTNNLDLGNKITMLKHLKECTNRGITLIMATHFPEHVFQYATKALLVGRGKVVEVSEPD